MDPRSRKRKWIAEQSHGKTDLAVQTSEWQTSSRVELPPSFTHWSLHFHQNKSSSNESARNEFLGSDFVNRELELRILRYHHTRQYRPILRILDIMSNRIGLVDCIIECMWRTLIHILANLQFCPNKQQDGLDENDEQRIHVLTLRLYQCLIKARYRCAAGTQINDHLVVEVAMYLARRAHLHPEDLFLFDEACQRLDSALSSTRTGKSWLHRCVAGMLNFAKWNRSILHLLHSQIDCSRSITIGDYYQKRDSIVNLDYQTARKHFEIALDIVRDGCVDVAFMRYIVVLWVVGDRLVEAWKLICKYVDCIEYRFPALELQLEFINSFESHLHAAEFQCENVESVKQNCFNQLLRIDSHRMKSISGLSVELNLDYLSRQKPFYRIRDIEELSQLIGDDYVGKWLDMLRHLQSGACDADKLANYLGYHFKSEVPKMKLKWNDVPFDTQKIVIKFIVIQMAIVKQFLPHIAWTPFRYRFHHEPLSPQLVSDSRYLCSDEIRSFVYQVFQLSSDNSVSEILAEL